MPLYLVSQGTHCGNRPSAIEPFWWFNQCSRFGFRILSSGLVAWSESPQRSVQTQIMQQGLSKVSQLSLEAGWMGPVGWFQGEQHVNLCQLMSTAVLCVLGSSWAVSMEPWATGTTKKPRSNKYFEVLPYFCISSSIITLVPWMVSIWDLTTGCPGVRSHIETVHGHSWPSKKSIYVEVFAAKVSGDGVATFSDGEWEFEIFAETLIRPDWLHWPWEQLHALRTPE